MQRVVDPQAISQDVIVCTAQDYLGHRDPKHTVRYTRVAGRRFEGLWD